MQTLASDLRFPEGPIAMPDGSVVLVELARGTLSRVDAEGNVSVIAELGGGPNGAAIGPDGHIYVCNNGGFDDQTDPSGRFASQMPREYLGGSIQRVNIRTGKSEDLYRECNGHSLRGPNDIVFDQVGGFWFTDLGKTWPRTHDHGGVYYASTDGKHIQEVIYPLITPNGIGISPDGSTLYVAETTTGKLYQWTIIEPGHLELGESSRPRAQLLYALPDGLRFDSLAVDAEGYVNVGVLSLGSMDESAGGICEVSPNGEGRIIPTGDPMTTNICFGGEDCMTAFITCSDSGTLRSLSWPRKGIRLPFYDKAL